MEKTIFAKLAAVDVNGHVDKKETGKDKNGNPIKLSYLSWAWAWDYFKKTCPDAKYEIKEWNGKPYLYDEKTGYMVQTSITACGETHTMWLPVMDSTNHALLDKAYQIQTKYKTIDIPAATMFDINKTLMRCLVKNMAMFGLGLYIYAGEDLPSDTDEVIESKQTQVPKKKRADQSINDLVGDEIPFVESKRPDPDNWMSVNAFAGEMERCNDIDDISALLNGQKGNPRLKELIPLASARKQEILNNMQMGV